MDQFDAHILNLLQHNARTTAEGMAQQIGLSPDACRKRMARLRSSGIIKAEIAVLDPASVGRGLILIVEVTLQTERKADLDRFKAAMQAAPEVMQCYYVTGNADFILIRSHAIWLISRPSRGAIFLRKTTSCDFAQAS